MRSETVRLGMRVTLVTSKLMYPSSTMRGLTRITLLVRLLCDSIMFWFGMEGMPRTVPAAEGGRDEMALAIALKVGGRGGSDMLKGSISAIRGDCRMVLSTSMKLSSSWIMGLDLR